MLNNEIMVVKQTTFDSAHYLPNYDGLCQHLHGHTYKLEVGFKGPIDMNSGMVVDFSKIKQQLNDIKDLLDHKVLNEVRDPEVQFPGNMPTAENMINWLRLKFQYANRDEIKVSFIRLWETPTSYAEWRE